MKNKNNLKTINWVIFTSVVLVGVVTATITLFDLNSTTYTTFGEEGQSRAELRWGFLHTIISVAILLISSFLASGWKRLFPFNVPIAIIIAGFCYVLFFLTFTIGWVGFLGIIGFFIAFLIGVILIVSYSVINFLESRMTKKI
ncbi:RND transporter [bacterium LRH843]|nr:RND transporter [bacterium LRH843]